MSVAPSAPTSAAPSPRCRSYHRYMNTCRTWQWGLCKQHRRSVGLITTETMGRSRLCNMQHAYYCTLAEQYDIETPIAARAQREHELSRYGHAMPRSNNGSTKVRQRSYNGQNSPSPPPRAARAVERRPYKDAASTKLIPVHEINATSPPRVAPHRRA
jgi:hypothetical protein